MLNRNDLNKILLLSAGALTVLATAIGILFAKQAPPSAPETVVLEEVVANIIDIRAAETPAPTAAPAANTDAVTLLVDRKAVLSMESEYDMQKLLWEFLIASAVPPAGERLVSATFDRELIIGRAAAGDEVISYENAAMILKNLPDIVPVRMVTQRVTGESTAVVSTQSTDKALEKGARILVSIGEGALTETTVNVTYLNGAEAGVSAPVNTVTRDARSTIVTVGAYTAGRGAGEPDQDEGLEGKSKGELKLNAPVKASVSSYFGYREGRMHNGIDYTVKADTEIVAPGEGVVVYCGERGAYGYVVDIDHGNGFLSRLTHLGDVKVELNQRVFPKESIGVLADEGTDYNNKPHYELIIDGVPYNPLFYIG